MRLSKIDDSPNDSEIIILPDHIEKVTEGIILLNADTRTLWFYRLSQKCDARMFTGALAFIDPETMKPKCGNRIGQVLFYVGPNVELFYSRFEKEGCFR